MMLFSFFVALCHTFTFSHSLALPLSSSGKAPTYDFIIIGGGTAGLTLASRLSENPAFQVAVIEAGGYYEQSDGNNSVIPGYAGYGTNADPTTANSTPSIDWGFVTAPIASLDGRQIHYARGKTLGGSSARNYMM
jgi:choline dehydrogenase